MAGSSLCRRAAGLAPACLAAALLLMARADGATYHAVLVGINDYACNDGGNDEFISDLSYCVADVADMQAMLDADPIWSGASITVLTDSQATKAGIEAAIDSMAGAAVGGDVCLFYFSGHGGADTDVWPYDELSDGLDEYIIPYDMANFDFAGAIRDDELSGDIVGHPWLSEVTANGAKLVVILDSCSSGGNVKSVSARTVKGIGPPREPGKGYDGIAADLVPVKTGRKDLNDLPNVVVLTACDDWESSTEDTILGNGAFTYHLVEGAASGLTDEIGALAGNGDGQISPAELLAYAAPQAAAYYDYKEVWRQHPQIYDGGPGGIDFLTAPLPPASTVASVTMAANPGWSTTGLWAWGQPTGAPLGPDGHGLPDPTSGHTDPYVYGYNLNGAYEDNLPPRYLTSTAFDCSAYVNVRLRFWRQLGVERQVWPDWGPADEAHIEVSNDGSSWQPVWSNPYDIDVSDTQWLQVEYDISAVADASPSVQIRWIMGWTDSMDTFCGWNIDDVEIVGTRTGGLAADPLSLSGQILEGAAAADLQFDLWSISDAPPAVDFSIDPGSIVYSGAAPWGDTATISCDTLSGTSTGPPDPVTVTVSFAGEEGLGIGIYTATIPVSDDTYGDTLPIQVVLTVTTPMIGRDPAFLSPTCRKTEDAVAQTFEVWNSGAGTLLYTVTDDADADPPPGVTDWISCGGYDGSVASTDAPDTVTVTYSTAAIAAAGTYTAQIAISDNGSAPAAGNSPQTVQVTLTVTEPRISLTPASILVAHVDGVNASPRTFQIANTGTGPLEYTLDIPGAETWLSIASPLTGTVTTTPATIELNFADAALAGLPLTADVTVSDPAATVTVETITVTIDFPPPGGGGGCAPGEARGDGGPAAALVLLGLALCLRAGARRRELRARPAGDVLA